MRGPLLMDPFLLYTGPINFLIRRELITGLRKKMIDLSAEMAIRKRVSYVFEELLSNVDAYYRKNRLEGEPLDIYMKLTGAPALEICISNTIRKTDTKAFLGNIDTLNAGSVQDIKELFQTGLQATTEEDGGSGIGLITIKMRTGQSFRVEITEKGQTENIIHLKTSITL